MLGALGRWAERFAERVTGGDGGGGDGAGAVLIVVPERPKHPVESPRSGPKGRDC